MQDPGSTAPMQQSARYEHSKTISFLSVLSTTDKNFPLELWDELVPQAEITLNLMRTCRSNKQISAYEAIREAIDMNKTQIAPAGTRVVIHVKPDIRASWDTHGDEGFYIGPALDHYRCYRCWVISTAAIRVTDTVAWHPETLQMPGDSPMDAFSAAINDLAESLKRLADNPALATHRQPIDTMTSSITKQLQNLGSIFQPPAPLPRDIETIFAMDPYPLTAQKQSVVAPIPTLPPQPGTHGRPVTVFVTSARIQPTDDRSIGHISNLCTKTEGAVFQTSTYTEHHCRNFFQCADTTNCLYAASTPKHTHSKAASTQRFRTAY